MPSTWCLVSNDPVKTAWCIFLKAAVPGYYMNIFTYQKKDLDQAAVHLLHFTLPPGPLPLCLDDLADLQEHHRPAGISSDVLLNEVSTRRILYVLPGMLYCENNNHLPESWVGFPHFTAVMSEHLANISSSTLVEFTGLTWSTNRMELRQRHIWSIAIIKKYQKPKTQITQSLTGLQVSVYTHIIHSRLPTSCGSCYWASLLLFQHRATPGFHPCTWQQHALQHTDSPGWGYSQRPHDFQKADSSLYQTSLYT